MVMSMDNMVIRRGLIVLALTITWAWAQVVGGGVSGTVKDESSAALPSAEIRIRSTETGAERTLITDDSGRYAALSLPVGNYEITVQKDGFQTQVKRGVTLAVGQQFTVNFTLAVG